MYWIWILLLLRQGQEVFNLCIPSFVGVVSWNNLFPEVPLPQLFLCRNGVLRGGLFTPGTATLNANQPCWLREYGWRVATAKHIRILIRSS